MLDIDALPEEYLPIVQNKATRMEGRLLRTAPYISVSINQGNRECSNSIFEIRYNDQFKRCKSCATVPFDYPVLEDFLLEYISNKSWQSGREPKIWY